AGRKAGEIPANAQHLLSGPREFLRIEHKRFTIGEAPVGNVVPYREGGLPQSGRTAVGMPHNAGGLGEPLQEGTTPRNEVGPVRQELAPGGPPRGPGGEDMVPINSRSNPVNYPEAATRLVSYGWAHPGWARAWNSEVGRGFYDRPW